jgi:hypothetical protein
MSCLNEGTLRAYLDRELPAEEMANCALHLAACADCHADYNELSGRTARVAAWMSALDAPPLAKPAATPAQRRNRVLPAAAMALAAALAYAFVAAPKHRAEPVAVNPRIAEPAIPVRLADAAAAPAALSGAPMVTAVRVQPGQLKTRQAIRPASAKADYFLALDDQPIETGYVVRLDLGDRQADVIFDGDGNARAIRPVTTK